MNQQLDDKEKVSSILDDQYSTFPTGKESKQNTSALVSFPKRYILLLMIFIGFVNIYAMRVNLNVALVAMVNNQTAIRQGVKITKVKHFFIDPVIAEVGLRWNSTLIFVEFGETVEKCFWLVFIS